MIAVLVYISGVARNAGEIRGGVVVPSSRKRPRRHKRRPRNNQKKNQTCRHLALRSRRCAAPRRERRRKTRESRRQCFNPSRALLRGAIARDAYASLSNVLEKGGGVVMRCFRSRVSPFSVSNKRVTAVTGSPCPCREHGILPARNCLTYSEKR